MVKLSCNAGAMNITMDSPLKVATRTIRAIAEGSRGGLQGALTEVRDLTARCKMRGFIVNFPGRVGGSVKRQTRGTLRFKRVLGQHANVRVIV